MFVSVRGLFQHNPPGADCPLHRRQSRKADVRQLFPVVRNESLLSIVWTLKLAPEGVAGASPASLYLLAAGPVDVKADSPARYLDRSGIGPC